MHSNLPQAARTSKLETLPEDLKGIAEEMLAKKFGVEEEVVPPRDDPFFGNISQPVNMADTAWRDGAAASSRFGLQDDPRFSAGVRHDAGRVEVEFHVETRSRVARTKIYGTTTRHIAYAMSTLDEQGLKNENRIIRIWPETWHGVQLDPSIMMNMNGARLWNADVQVIPHHYLQEIQQEIRERF